MLFTLLTYVFICASLVDVVPRTSRRIMRMNKGAHLLYAAIAQNRTQRQAGDETLVDIARYTNSTDFVMALCRESGELSSCLGCYTNVWCIAVDPPDDCDMIPVLFTANIRPSDLFRREDDAKRTAKLTCPKTWGGECFGVCEDAAIVVRRGGAACVVKGKYAGSAAFPIEQLPTVGTVAYLTPTGRVDLVFGK